SVRIISKENLPLMKKQSEGHYAATVPLLYLKYLFDKKNNKNNTELAIDAAIILSNAYTFAGAAAYLNSGSKLLWTLGALDILASTSGTSLAVVKPLVESKYGKESDTYKCIEKVDKYILVYNLSRVVSDLVVLPALRKDAAEIWAKEKKIIKDDGVISSEQYDDIEKIVGNEIDATIDVQIGKTIYPTVKINGVPVVRLLCGSNGKIAIIGRRMEYVRKIATDLKALGKDVELFEKTTAFNGQGYHNLAEIERDWQNTVDLYEDGIIPYSKLKTTLWYKENQRWAIWIKEQGYDIYDLGDNPGMFLNAPNRSAFYDIEKIEIFDDVIN
ncbi:MAG: hypothetical protein ABUL44_01085, partial [Flavobacterium sp.]